MKKEELELLLTKATDDVSKQILAEAIRKIDVNVKKRAKKESKTKRELNKAIEIRRTKFYNWLAEKKQDLIKNQTPSEVKIKALLKSLNITYEFQKIFMDGVNGYIPDFYLPYYNLVVEVDGKHHYTAKGEKADTKRTKELIKYSKIKGVLRLPNNKVKTLTPEELKDLIVNYKEPIENLPSIATPKLPKEKNKPGHFTLVQKQLDKMSPKGKKNYLKKRGLK
jgi:very-short-patch-repair endonuclease